MLLNMNHVMPGIFAEPREKGHAEWQTFNSIHRDSGAYTISAFQPRTPVPSQIIRYGEGHSRLLILKRA